MRRSWLLIGFLAAALFSSRAETYQLTTGESITGEMLVPSANDQGVQIKVGEGEYKRVPWTSFSQDDLRKFRQTPKLAPLVEPYIEITTEERIKKTEVPIKQPPRLQLPAKQSLLSSMFSSGPGLLALLLMYAATIYAGYEVAIFRGASVPLVAGLSAIPFLGVLVPIIFLCIPTKVEAAPMAWETGAGVEGQPQTHAAAATEVVNPMQGEVAHPQGLKLHTEPAPAQPEVPAATTFQRGQFTFNRRFFETKFPGFFPVVRREADKDMVLIIKSARGEYIVERFTRIAANDIHAQVHYGHESQEIMIPYQDIKEIQLKHKDTP